MLTNQHFSYYSTVALKNQEKSRYFYKTDENGGAAAVNAGKSFLRSLRGNRPFPLHRAFALYDLGGTVGKQKVCHIRVVVRGDEGFRL